MARPEYYSESSFAPDTNSATRFKLLAVALTLVFTTGMLLLAAADYRRSSTRAQQELSYFAELFDQTIDASLNVANLKMWAMIEDISTLPFRYADSIDAYYGRRLRQALEDIDQIDSLVLIENAGTVMWSTTEALIGLSLYDRTYFQDASSLSRGMFTIGSPITSRVTGRRLAPIAWPVISQAGEIRGVIASALGEEYFAELLSLQGIDDGILVRILTQDGDVAFATGATDIDLINDGMSATRSMPNLGLEVQVTRSREAVMGSYWDRTIAFGTVSSLLFMTILLSAIRSRSKSVMLAEGLRRSERDRLNLQNTQREFDAIFENVGDGIVVFDEFDTLHRSNLAARELLGAKDHASAVRRLRDRLPSLAQIPTKTAVYPLNLSAAPSDDTVQNVQCRVMKLQLYGSEIAYCVLADVTAEERLAETRMSFVTSVNHELRTPLTSLSGALDILSARHESHLPDNAKKLLSMASRNADRLLVLVNDILTLQAIDQQQLSITLEPVSVAEALVEAATTNAGYGAGHGVSIIADPVPNGSEVYLLLDKVRLQQILANLISNAVKYSPAGAHVRVGADVTPTSVAFYVTDEGPGIPADALARLFDRFTKPVHHRDVQVSGTGLGLAITRELVHRQGGSIEVSTQSKADGAKVTGSTFTVRFKRTQLREEQST